MGKEGRERIDFQGHSGKCLKKSGLAVLNRRYCKSGNMPNESHQQTHPQSLLYIPIANRGKIRMTQWRCRFFAKIFVSLLSYILYHLENDLKINWTCYYYLYAS
ncbi:hypothetical protein K492DRAFT_4296 [Lichtheimia hyalospora FSU 10163]|nr:hypothetical protein K492DRAFT_4296 [Lichtheimia hyalospora FSU 10163]